MEGRGEVIALQKWVHMYQSLKKEAIEVKVGQVMSYSDEVHPSVGFYYTASAEQRDDQKVLEPYDTDIDSGPSSLAPPPSTEPCVAPESVLPCGGDRSTKKVQYKAVSPGEAKIIICHSYRGDPRSVEDILGSMFSEPPLPNVPSEEELAQLLSASEKGRLEFRIVVLPA